MIYKAFKLGKVGIAFNKFPITAKNVSDVYLTGIRNWDADDSKNYSAVVGVCRIIVSFDKNIGDCNG